MNKPSLKRLFLIGINGSLVASAFMGIVILLGGNLDSTGYNILFTTAVVGLFSITSLLNLPTLDSKYRSYRYYSFLSILVSLLAFILIEFLIWFGSSSDILNKLAASLSVLAISSAHASLILPLRQRSDNLRLMTSTTFVFIAAVASMLIYLIWNLNGDAGDLFFRLLGVFAILDVLGTVTVPIMAKMTPKKRPLKTKRK